MKHEALVREIAAARDQKHVKFYALMSSVETVNYTIFIQFAEHVENATVDKLISYIERTYNAGVKNRDFHNKQLTLTCYE